MAKQPDSLELGAHLQRLNDEHARAFERWRAGKTAAARKPAEKAMAAIETKRKRVRKLLASAAARAAATTRAARARPSSPASSKIRQPPASSPAMSSERRALAQKGRGALQPTQAKRRRSSSKGWRIEDSRTLFVPRCGALTFELRWVQCGKARCRKWHGPYWYAEQHRGERVRWVYVGAKLDVDKAVERMRAK